MLILSCLLPDFKVLNIAQFLSIILLLLIFIHFGHFLQVQFRDSLIGRGMSFRQWAYSLLCETTEMGQEEMLVIRHMIGVPIILASAVQIPVSSRMSFAVRVSQGYEL